MITIAIIWLSIGLALVLAVNHHYPGEHGPRSMMSLIIMWPVMVVQIAIDRIRGGD